MHDFDEFERRLAVALRSDADVSVGPFMPESIARAAIADSGLGASRVRRSSRHTRRVGRGRGLTLFAAAALLLVGGALAGGSGLLRLPSVVPPVPAPSFGVVATASPDAASPSPTRSAAPSASPIPVAGPGGAWIATGPMVTSHSEYDAVRLFDGRVLAVGRSGGRPDLDTAAELYDPASGTWSATERMLKPRAGFPPTLLLNGEVLVGHVEEWAADVSTVGAEVYDPERGTWTATGKMVREAAVWAADFGSAATLLRDGRVLVTGHGGTQVYDPDSGTWSAAEQMSTPRHSHTATLLRDGRVLAMGGYDEGDRPLGSAELYDPDTGSWTAIASTHSGPFDRNCSGCPGGTGWATLLQDGTLLFIRSSREVVTYDPDTGIWTALPDSPVHETATLLSDGTVLVAGPDGPEPCPAAALYDPRTGSSTTVSSMLRCGYGSTFTPLLDDTVLVAGGRECNDDGACVSRGVAELFVPAGVSPPPFDFPTPAPPVFPSPTPEPTPLPPASGPVPRTRGP